MMNDENCNDESLTLRIGAGEFLSVERHDYHLVFPATSHIGSRAVVESEWM